MKVALELQPCCGQKSGIGNYTYEIAKRLQNTDEIHFEGNIFDFCGQGKIDLSEISYKVNVNK